MQNNDHAGNFKIGVNYAAEQIVNFIKNRGNESVYPAVKPGYLRKLLPGN